jgi:hypothetical protein
MPTCSFTHVFRSTRKVCDKVQLNVPSLLIVTQKRRNLQHPTSIEIRARTVDDVDTSRGAILTCDTSSDSNLISHRLVTKVLGEQYHQIEKADTMPIRTQVYGEHIYGHVDLDWCWESNTEQWHNTRFLVTTTYDPPYDAVLGRKDAEQYGMIRARSRQ